MTDFTPLTTETPAEHPFAQFVRILGKGKRGARSLTREEAREAMGMLIDEKVEDTQLGAFLMLLRHKEESPEELAGFTEAVRERLHAPALNVDIDWPTYAGKKRHLPWYLLAAKCLAQNGVRVLLHGGGPSLQRTAAGTAGHSLVSQLASRGRRAGATEPGLHPLGRLGPPVTADDRSAQHPGPALADPFPCPDPQPAGCQMWPAEHFPPRLPGRSSR